MGKEVGVKIKFQRVQEGLGRKETEYMNHIFNKTSVEKYSIVAREDKNTIIICGKLFRKYFITVFSNEVFYS